MDMTYLLRSLIIENFDMTGIAYYNKWIEIDTPDDLRLASKIFAEEQ